ncbi:response regulator receiver protein [Desulfobulbus propionicus DSM 2032]|uniref:Response regulator receiver protein n=1 Tax=Desulfobulbus propionicus (strain ATCC 33891 / DSM 2032 / VKM B-1956 / 1pr3) TaxID=577650 RepID=A0A7U3YNW2_DESPD|nr:HEAT repeat domain-containing protein [Desulfobulbus propionicus]ADW18698.1 response regulator receiver protein [Desulfobulbus propionicus DSM 2032]
MAALNADHMIEEIQANIQTGDALKARLVLDHLGEVDKKTQNRLLYELSRGEVAFTVPLLNHLLTTQPELCTDLPIIRETLISHLIAYPDVLLNCLVDPHLADKTVMIETAGELKFEEATPVLVGLLAATNKTATIKLIIENLGLIGDPESINALTDYLYAADRELIIAAIHALGQVGTNTAMHRLAERMGTDNELDLIILGVFSEVQDQVSLEKLNDTLRSHYAHMRIYAKDELVRIGVKAVPVLIENLKESDSDLLIHTLNVLGEIGDESAIMPIRSLLNTMPRNPNVRFAAYEALALLPLRKGAYTLAAGLNDSEDHVCTAAARAIDRNFNEILAAGIKNMVRAQNDEARHIVKIIVNAQVDNLFLRLAKEDYFQELALIYLPHAHRDIRQHYIALLNKEGLGEFAARIAGEEREGGTRIKVCAVDDSRMILNIYKATLHELGFEPVLFEFPAGALEWLAKEKPALVLTDLNMPEISGIELTRRIRTLYPSESLPVIMVTTQSDVQDHEAASAAGVNDILIKPFSAESLRTAMGKYIKGH